MNCCYSHTAEPGCKKTNTLHQEHQLSISITKMCAKFIILLLLNSLPPRFLLLFSLPPFLFFPTQQLLSTSLTSKQSRFSRVLTIKLNAACSQWLMVEKKWLTHKIIIIMYIYHVLINALSAHMIHTNLNMIFYTHIEHSPTKTIYIQYYMEKKHTHYTHTHTHIESCRNWVLILVGMKILWEEEGFQFGFKIWQGLVGVNSKCGVQSKRRCGSHESCICVVEFSAYGCQKKR